MSDGEVISDKPTLRSIQNAVARHFGCGLNVLLSRRRNKREALARNAAMWLCRRATAKSLPQIGAAFGRHHTTILVALRRIDALMGADPAFDAEMRALLIALLPAPVMS